MRALIGLLLLLGTAVPSRAQTRSDLPVPLRRIRIVITGLRNDLGLVRCALFDRAEAFPGGTNAAVDTTRSRIAGRKASCEFSVKRAGWYAIAAYHDENENARFDRNWLGIPVEGHATSNNVKTILTVPKFAAARFVYLGGHLELHSYMMY